MAPCTFQLQLKATKQPSLGCLLMDWAAAEELILCRLLEDIF